MTVRQVTAAVAKLAAHRGRKGVAKDELCRYLSTEKAMTTTQIWLAVHVAIRDGFLVAAEGDLRIPPMAQRPRRRRRLPKAARVPMPYTFRKLVPTERIEELCAKGLDHVLAWMDANAGEFDVYSLLNPLRPSDYGLLRHVLSNRLAHWVPPLVARGLCLRKASLTCLPINAILCQWTPLQLELLHDLGANFYVDWVHVNMPKYRAGTYQLFQRDSHPWTNECAYCLASVAIEAASLEVLQWLCTLMPDLAFADMRYRGMFLSPIEVAIRCRNRPAALWLYDLQTAAGLPRNVLIQPKTALALAMQTLQPDLVQELLRHGADPNELSVYTSPMNAKTHRLAPLCIAAVCLPKMPLTADGEDVFDLLIRFGADVNGPAIPEDMLAKPLSLLMDGHRFTRAQALVEQHGVNPCTVAHGMSALEHYHRTVPPSVGHPFWEGLTDGWMPPPKGPDANHVWLVVVAASRRAGCSWLPAELWWHIFGFLTRIEVWHLLALDAGLPLRRDFEPNGLTEALRPSIRRYRLTPAVTGAFLYAP